jgi:hypothetical protein
VIATRQRPFRLPIMALLQVLAFFGVVYALVRIPVTHGFIFNGPLKPVWKQVGGFEKRYLAPTLDPIFTPISVLNLTRKLNAREKEIITLKKALLSAQGQIGSMRLAASRKQARARTAASASVAMPAAAGPATSATSAPLVQVTPSPDEAKTGAYWSSMEAENVAAIAQKLDPVETARIFLAMKPDQAAAVMNVLPASYNVKLQAVRLTYPQPSVQ